MNEYVVFLSGMYKAIPIIYTLLWSKYNYRVVHRNYY